MRFFCHHQIFLLLENTFKVTLQYLFNAFILFNTVSYIKLNFKLKIDPKMRTFKNLEETKKKKTVNEMWFVIFLNLSKKLRVF